MPSKKSKDMPWWHHPNPDQIWVDDDARHRCRLPPHIINRIVTAFVNKKIHNRPKRAKRKWQESVWVDGVRVFLSCKVESGLIAITQIRCPGGAFVKLTS